MPSVARPAASLAIAVAAGLGFTGLTSPQPATVQAAPAVPSPQAAPRPRIHLDPALAAIVRKRAVPR